MEQFEKVCKGLECCVLRDPDDHRRCGECPYNPHAISNEPCANGLKFDALALIRQQQEKIKELEAAQTARMLTLEDVKDSEVVYLEDFSDLADGVEPIIRPAVNVEAKNGGIVMLDSATWDEGFIFVVDSEYGKTWRCWTQRPTDEQMEAVEWQ